MKTNEMVAKKVFAGLPEKALLRRHEPPNPRRLATFIQRMTHLGYEMDVESSGSLQSSLFQVEETDIRKGMETLLVKSMARAKYCVAGRTPEDTLSHYAHNLPLFTHFTNPSRRYADIVVHRQLEAVLSEGAIEFTEDTDSLAKTAEQCNTKKDSAYGAQEQSVHIEACRIMDKKAKELGGDLVAEGIVLCVYESAFDVLIPEWGFEKRVHCDQLPLKKAEFDNNKRLLELYWEKGVPSSAYVPEDERPKARSGGAGARDNHAAKQREADEANRRQLDTGHNDDADLFDDDDDDSVNELTEMTSGVALNLERSSHSVPPSPTRNGMPGVSAQRTNSDSKMARSTNTAESKLSDKEKYKSWFTLREEGGNYIQEIREMTKVPIILKTDLSKSPP